MHELLQSWMKNCPLTSFGPLLYFLQEEHNSTIGVPGGALLMCSQCESLHGNDFFCQKYDAFPFQYNESNFCTATIQAHRVARIDCIIAR